MQDYRKLALDFEKKKIKKNKRDFLPYYGYSRLQPKTYRGYRSLGYENVTIETFKKTNFN